jgi:hypothetical protein
LERVPPPLTLQETPALFESLVTVAVTVVVSVGSTVAEAAETVTLLGGLAHPERPMRAKDAIATIPASTLSLRVART